MVTEERGQELKAKLVPLTQELPGRTGKWLTREENAEARFILEAWIRRKVSGEPVISVLEIHKILVEEFGLPFQNASAFTTWLRAVYRSKG